MLEIYSLELILGVFLMRRWFLAIVLGVDGKSVIVLDVENG